jgi:hypothetical protein
MDMPSAGPQGAPPPSEAGSSGQAPKSNRSLVIIIAVLVGLAILGWGCNVLVGNMIGFGVKKAIEAETGVTVDERGGTVTFKGEDGATAVIDESGSGTITYKDETGKEVTIETQAEGDAKTLPKDFPPSFPVMAGMQVVATYSLASSEGVKTFTIEWSTSASVEAVAEYYGRALKDSGWNVSVTTTSEEGVYLVFDRGPDDAEQKDGGWLTISPGAEGGTQVSTYLVIAAE